MKKRVLRIVLVVLFSAAMAIPLISRLVAAKDGPKPATESPLPPGGASSADPLGLKEPVKPKVDPSAVVLSVGGEKVTAAEFDGFIADLPPDVRAQVQGPGKRLLAEELVKIKLLSAEAKKRGLDKKPDVQDQIKVLRERMERQMKTVNDQVLAGAVANSPEMAKKYFDEHKDQYGQVKARHILIATGPSRDPSNSKKALTDEQAKAKASEIRARLVKGEDFAAVCKKESDDPGSKDTGGEYTFGRGKMVPEFEKTAFGLKVNEISEPVKTNFGYHIIQLQERLPPTFEEAKAQATRDAVDALIIDLKKNETTTYNEDYFGAGPKPAPSAKIDAKSSEEKPLDPNDLK